MGTLETNHRVPSKTLDLLSRRETRGTATSRISACRGHSALHGGLERLAAPRVEELSSAIAWNPARMRNMVLAVGSQTPASVVMTGDSRSSSDEDFSSDEGNIFEPGGSDSGHDHDSGREDQITDEPEKMEEDAESIMLAHRVLANADGCEDAAEESKEDLTERRRRRRTSSDNSDSNQSAMADIDDCSDSPASSSSGHRCLDPQLAPRTKISNPMPAASSMRHGGCINTAAWLKCPWRLSLANHADNTLLANAFIQSSSHSSNSASASFLNGDMTNSPNRSYGGHAARSIRSDECPTQLMTSGDDRIVKFWDVSGALGSISPWPGGPATCAPFSTSRRMYVTPPDVAQQWKQRSSRGDPIPGAVVPLAHIQTGHFGNVFHVTPIPHSPGKVATCAADGYLRLCNVEADPSSSSTIIVSPDTLDNGGLVSFMRDGMCFSHHFLDDNTGLLCSERGLLKFDLRLPPREQPRGSILGGEYISCKTCAIWSAGPSEGIDNIDGDGFESGYVFAGGANGNVALCDLRMHDNSSKRIVQLYRPRALDLNATVSVSGIDVSRDKRELLVSYESDQIYTFPIFPETKSAAGPSLDELEAYSDEIVRSDNDMARIIVRCDNESDDGLESDDSFERPQVLIPELASYGGHLNRFTFLKMAKYAGPKDEYICIGSDSGHAWIYDKATGTVASILKADHSTCNGVVPHPSLPAFITYGIDSTAKLWRASSPVDNDVDDSELGRTNAFFDAEYQASLLVTSWRGTWRKLASQFWESEEEIELSRQFHKIPRHFTIFPDEIPESKGRNVLFVDAPTPYIANDMQELPNVLTKNYFDCVSAESDGDEAPIMSSLHKFKRRVGFMRLKHQADRLGLCWDPDTPWAMAPKAHVQALEESIQGDKNDYASRRPLKYGLEVDRLPNHPADWIPFDKEMTLNPHDYGMEFSPCYRDFYHEHYDKMQGKMRIAPADEILSAALGADCSNGTIAKTAMDKLYNTIMLLKEGGNTALSAGNVHLAARRYDKAIRYSAVAFMWFPERNLVFVTSAEARDNMQKGVGMGFETRWTPLLKLFVTVRLNLALATLRPEIDAPTLAKEQASIALHALKPFAKNKGKVMVGRKLDKEREQDEPRQTYIDAKELEVKAYFRLGSAQSAVGDYAAAIRNFGQSIQCRKDLDPDAPSEPLILRRIAEAKKGNTRKKERQRKKFKFAFADGKEEGEKGDGDAIEE